MPTTSAILRRYPIPTVNDITGDKIATKSSSQAYRDNWDRIFGNRDNNEKDDVVSTEPVFIVDETSITNC